MEKKTDGAKPKLRAFRVSGHHYAGQLVGESDKSCPLYDWCAWLTDKPTNLGLDADGEFTINGRTKDNYSVAPMPLPWWATMDDKSATYKMITDGMDHPAIRRTKKGEVLLKLDADMVARTFNIKNPAEPAAAVQARPKNSKDGWVLMRVVKEGEKAEVVGEGNYDGLWARGKRKFGVTPSAKEWRKGSDGADYRLEKAPC